MYKNWQKKLHPDLVHTKSKVCEYLIIEMTLIQFLHLLVHVCVVNVM